MPREPPDDRVHATAIDHDAREVLLAAGYKPREASAAVENARPHVGADARGAQVVMPREPPDDRVHATAIDHDAREALLAAGYKPREVSAAIERARPHVGADATLEQVVREALRRCVMTGNRSL